MYTQFKKHKKFICLCIHDKLQMYKSFIDEINEKQLFDFW